MMTQAMTMPESLATLSLYHNDHRVLASNHSIFHISLYFIIVNLIQAELSISNRSRYLMHSERVVEIYVWHLCSEEICA